MNLVDAAAGRRERRQRFSGRLSIIAFAVVAAAFAGVCAVALGLMIGATAEDFRHSIVDSVFDDRETGPAFWGAGTAGYLWILGTFGLGGSAALASWSIRVYRGGERAPAVIVPILFALVAVVVAVDARSWLEPLRVGIRIDPVFHHDVPWDAGSWIAYAAGVWFPVLLAALAAFLVIVAVRQDRRRRAQRILRTRLLREGRRVPGIISNVVTRTATNDVGQRSVIGLLVEVRFADADGVDRRVSRYTTHRTLVRGMDAEVMFDLSRPGDDRATFVAFDRNPLTSEWVGPAG